MENGEGARILSFRGHVTMPGNILGCHNGGACSWRLVLNPLYCAGQPHNQGFSNPNTNSATIDNLSVMIFVIIHPVNILVRMSALGQALCSTILTVAVQSPPPRPAAHSEIMLLFRVHRDIGHPPPTSIYFRENQSMSAREALGASFTG